MLQVRVEVVAIKRNKNTQSYIKQLYTLKLKNIKHFVLHLQNSLIPIHNIFYLNKT